MRGELVFHQALFGYDAGHHLIEASLKLSTELRHFLAVATDLSGSSPALGFETSYTGMPLPGSSYYALFCTWLAPEMPRPGSVWSQVIFIELGDLAEIENLGALRAAFRRPTSNLTSEYDYPVRLKLLGGRQSVFESATWEPDRLLEALYVTSDKSVVLTSFEETTTEDLVFAIWSQQWPRLRRSFRFSTGSFADRGRGESIFDLQVSPAANRRVWQRDSQYTILDGSESNSHALKISVERPWMESAKKDLLFPDATDFRAFLCANGSDVNHPREAFAKLASVREQIESKSGGAWVEVLELVGEMFPDSSEAISLKKQVCNPPARGGDDVDRNLATASFLLASNNSTPFQTVSLDLTELARTLWQLKREEVLDLLARLVRQPEKKSASAFAKAVAETVKPQELRAISDHRPELLPLMLGQNPELALHEELWLLPPTIQWRAYEALEELGLGNGQWAELISVLGPAKSAIAPRGPVVNAGAFAMQGAFRWVEGVSKETWIPTEQWREALAEPAAAMLKGDHALSPVRVAFCAWLLSPQFARHLLSPSRMDVQALASQPLEELPIWLRSYTAFLLVTLGLGNIASGGVNCLVRGFFDVYDALASGNYPNESWLLLSPELPNLGMWQEWDRCKKLRRAIKALPKIEARFVANSLLEAATNPDRRALAKRLLP